MGSVCFETIRQDIEDEALRQELVELEEDG